MSRDESRVGHPVLFDERERLLRIELIHNDNCSAEALNCQRPSKRCGMVKRRGGEIYAVGIHSVQRLTHLCEWRWVVNGAVGEWRLGAFRSTRGAGGIQHVGARVWMRDHAGGERRSCGSPIQNVA